MKFRWLDLKNNIRNVRKEMKFSQEELANKCGVTRQTINAIENNKYDPTLALAFKLSLHLNTQIEKLFSYEEEKK
jgi:putative transcriptional regulator